MNIYLLIFLILISLEYLLDSITDFLDLKAFSPILPDEFQGTYDPARYEKARQYKSDNTSFGFVQRTVSLSLFIAFLLLGGFNWVDQLARDFAQGFSSSEPVLGIFYAAILSLLKMLTGLPFSFYATFVIEERYGFNKTTGKTYLADLLKGLLLTVILGAPLFAGLIYFFQSFGPSAWLYAWLFITTVQLSLMYIAPAWILPLFNKFEPLKDGELRNRIIEYMNREHFDLEGVYTMDGSRRSTKANAFFTGFGKLRRLVLFDTLIEKHSIEELVAVLAHEVGHFRRNHILKSIALTILVSGIVFYTFSFFIGNPQIADAFGMQFVSVYSSLIFISLLYSPVTRLFSLVTQAISRKHEFEADEFSARTYGKPEALALALKKLSADSMANLTPHPLKILLDYSHPPVLQRIRALRAFTP
ncbi:MAG: peptidase M48 [Bdellovibrionales bacterium GWB1_52_6]|nr:MAG: peptidase M48 [Bdellovibrionales bacterium GWB1_52_6]OFZ04063.1 MAG: peptidase M48 [Bdellovibrionales bacterium GWA1_52_35]HCM39851.1 peptidase M48 [Bdellovibrionales bacterium]